MNGSCVPARGLPGVAALLVLWVVLATVTAAASEPRTLDFLRGLRDRGYGDTAVEYLQMLQKQGDVPPELRDIWELEMSENLRVAAQDAYDAREAQQLADQARTALEKFVHDKPDDYRTGLAITTLGMLAADRGLKLLDSAHEAGNTPTADKLREEARAALEDARARFQQAIAKYDSPVTPKPPEATPKEKRRGHAQEVLDKWETDRQLPRLQTAQVDYYLSKTYPDSQGDERRAALRKAAREFDDFFQANRMNTLGLQAHKWFGKMLEELGDTATAIEVYDEVLVNDSDANQPTTDPKLQAFFAEVALSRLQLLAQQGSGEQFLAEATEWLRQNHDRKRTDGYQGIALALAKTLLAKADESLLDERTKLNSKALTLLSEIVAVRSPYQQEAIRLRTKHSKALAAVPPKTFDEALGVADLAAQAGAWQEAAASYAQALSLAEKTNLKDTERIHKAQESLANARLMAARQAFSEGKLDEAIAAAREVIRNSPDSSAAPLAAALAVGAALELFAAAPEAQRPDALERLKKMADYTMAKWPGKPEADDARMALGQASLVSGKADEALKVFESVNSKSERYARALYLIGTTYWQRYLVQKTAPEAERNSAQMSSDRAKAQASLQRSLEVQKASADAALTRQQTETQLLLAEIALEGGQKGEGEALLRPLIEGVRRTGLTAHDATSVNIAVAALRVYLDTGNFAEAKELGLLLADSGFDAPAVNAVLLRLVQAVRKPTRDAAAGTSAAKPELSEADRILLQKLLPKLTKHERLSPAALAYVADSLTAVDLAAEAEPIYRRLIELADHDPEVARVVGPILARARTQLVDELLQQGKYEEAAGQIAQAVAAHPRALPLLMQQGRILQAWAEHDARHYPEAIEQWRKVRGMLLNLRPKPAEYFEATYGLAWCLYQAASAPSASEASTQAKQAEQLLKADLVLYPKLGGEELVGKYRALLQQIAQLQANLPAGTK